MTHKIIMERTILSIAGSFLLGASALAATNASSAAGDSSAAARVQGESGREKLLMDFNWKFHLGDAPDAGAKFDYPEVRNLAKTQIEDIGKEGELADLSQKILALTFHSFSRSSMTANGVNWICRTIGRWNCSSMKTPT